MRVGRLVVGASVALAAVLVTTVASPGPVSAATYTVCDEECSFTSIQQAINAAAEGDTILVRPGFFNEAITIDKPLTLLGAQSGIAPVGDPRDPAESTISAEFPITITASDVTVDGFEITGFQTGISIPGPFPGPSYTRKNIVIRNNWIHSYAGDPTPGGTVGAVVSAIHLDPNRLEDLTISTNQIDISDPVAIDVVAAILCTCQERGGEDAVLDSPTISNDIIGVASTAYGHGIYGGPNASDYRVESATITDNRFLSSPYAIGLMNIYGATLTGNLVSDGPVTLGIRDASISGNPFLDGSHLELLGTATGTTDPSANVTVTNNVFADGTGGRAITVDASATNSYSLPGVGPASVDASSITVHHNAFGGAADANRVRNLGTGSLDADLNWWDAPSGPAVCATPPSTSCATLGDVSTDRWIHAYTADSTELPPSTWPLSLLGYESALGFWPVEVKEGFNGEAPVTTPTGTAVSQTFYFSAARYGSVSFESVTTAGTTTVRVLGPTDGDYVTPAGFTSGTPSPYVDIQTTAVFSGKVTVCLVYDTGAFPAGVRPQMFHYAASTWTDVTYSADAASLTVCGSTTALSPFTLGYGAVRPVTIRAVYDVKEYDGTTASARTPEVDPSTPLVLGDTAINCGQSFDDSEAGYRRTLTPFSCQIIDSESNDITHLYTITYETTYGDIFGELPRTGNDGRWVTVVGLGMLLLGALLIVSGQRRRSAASPRA